MKLRDYVGLGPLDDIYIRSIGGLAFMIKVHEVFGRDDEPNYVTLIASWGERALTRSIGRDANEDVYIEVATKKGK